MNEVLLQILVNKVGTNYYKIRFYAGTDDDFKTNDEDMCGVLVMKSEAWAKLRDCLEKDMKNLICEL